MRAKFFAERAEGRLETPAAWAHTTGGLPAPGARHPAIGDPFTDTLMGSMKAASLLARTRG
ncbi:hypothetical protein ACFW5D_12915 [Streptomyces sp. NPDC058770]|uniref:hypothetical protein n=1 Tax=Streptomyces sp. NPDC058770 TaxID=3346631 RepID=UPI00369D70D0